MVSENQPLLGSTKSGGTKSKKQTIAIIVGVIALVGAAIAGFVIWKKKPVSSVGHGPTSSKHNLPNIIVFMVDDLGWNQVGYHAIEHNNTEIKTPNIDKYSGMGIRMDRGYMTPWCAPSRSTFQTGSMNSFNGYATNDVYAFDDDIGFIGGLQAGTVTLPMALKYFTGNETKTNYSTSYAGKWGIGGTAWANTPMALGYDTFLGYWGDSMDSCDGWVPISSVPGTDGPMLRAVPGYWTQNKTEKNPYCDDFKLLKVAGTLTQEEIDIACATVPRTPSKIVDEELLDYTLDIINKHNYDEGPLYHMHATQLLHLPMQYPSSYDEDEESPLSYLKGSVKPVPNNTILRLKTSNMLRWLDDIFFKIVNATVSQGQWDNTIILFTSDNGGAIYTNSANNNYPLRGSKLSSFEGGIRVSQFLTGGWLKQKIPNMGVNATSDTYVVVNDWAPTLLGMVGDNKTYSYLLGNATGPPYGNDMWDYIKKSVTPGPSPSEHQKERNVTFNPTLYLDIRNDSAFKYIETKDLVPQYFARHWGAIWPTDDDIIPDFGYKHIHPCRPNGKKLNCCYFRIDEDENETNPLPVDDCKSKGEFAEESFYDGPTCDTWKKQLCNKNIKAVPNARNQEYYTLWTLLNASGPFTNSSGYPITADTLLGSQPPSAKCACSVTSTDSPNAFIPAPTSPSICIDRFEHVANRLKIECNGEYSREPFHGDYLDSYAAEGFPRDLVETWFKADETSEVARGENVPMAVKMFSDYVTRQNHTEWPNYAKFPYVAAGQNTCPDKNVTPNPIPALAMTLWFVRQGDVTALSKRSLDLCIGYGGFAGQNSTSFCPSVHNAKQEKITYFDYSEDNPYYTILTESGSERKIEAMTAGECLEFCRPERTAYIGDGPWGLKHDLI